jgi:hypothetical protein
MAAQYGKMAIRDVIPLGRIDGKLICGMSSRQGIEKVNILARLSF